VRDILQSFEVVESNLPVSVEDRVGKIESGQVAEVAGFIFVGGVVAPEAGGIGVPEGAGEIEPPGLAIAPFVIQDAEGNAHFESPAIGCEGGGAVPIGRPPPIKDAGGAFIGIGPGTEGVREESVFALMTVGGIQVDFDPIIRRELAVLATFHSSDLLGLIVETFDGDVEEFSGIGQANPRLLISGLMGPGIDEIGADRRVGPERLVQTAVDLQGGVNAAGRNGRHRGVGTAVR